MVPGSLFGGSNGIANPTPPLVADETPPQKGNPGNADIVQIATGGDVVVCVEHETKSIKHTARFRVSTPALKQHSKYFERLLQPGRFGEANRIEEQHRQLKERYQNLAEVPIEELPSVSVQDLGRISSVKSISTLVADFFQILHGQDLDTLPPVANLANLAVVSDRFDALDVVKSYVGRKKIIRALDGKTTPKVDNALSEEKVRQRLLVAVMLDYPPWVEKYSARLIVKGWVGREADLSEAL
ncbi:hypothetical protein KC352_g34685, partial [Hortaea werneckii]